MDLLRGLMQVFEQWSYANLGQWHYALGYTLTLVSHNWPIMLALILGGWFGFRAYRQPSRARVSWLLTAILFGLAYEYRKHIAGELHAAVDFLFIGELAGLNRLMHWLVGPALSTALTAGSLAVLAQSVRLTLAERQEPSAPQPAPRTTYGPKVIDATR
jgi:uncharacterized membrane protein YedE/YeeE